MTNIRRVCWPLLAAAMAPLSASAGETQDLTAVTKAAQDFITDAARAATSGEVEVTAGRLDERLQLPACESALQRFLPPGGRTLGDTTVGVRCDKPKPWMLYVPVRVAVYGDVLIAARALPHNTLLKASDLSLARRELGGLYAGYLANSKQAIGMLLRRPLSAGAVLEPDALTAPRLVERGQHVVLLSRGAGIEVRAAGEALADGAEGEWVQVRNTSSQRIVEGTVVAAGIVQVPL